jgi:outer membrane lipoprotein-sorting protein
LRWLTPALAVVVAAAAGSVISAVTATARDSLPPRSAQQLLVDVQTAQLKGLSGTLSQTAELGLPALPGLGGSSSDFSSMVSGSHTLRVWYAGPERVRVALMGKLGESDLIRNGSDVWTWSSTGKSVSHLSLPATSPGGKSADTAAPTTALTPQQAAEAAIKAITPTTRVTTDPTAVVAGRPAYQLVLEPKDTGTLVGSVRIAIDGATHIPTQVQVYAKGASAPALEVGFTSFNPTTPAASVFDFTPPAGATVTEQSLPTPSQKAGPSAPGAAQMLKGTTRPQVVGQGWSSVVVATLPIEPPKVSSGDTPGSGDTSPPLAALTSVLDSLPPVSGSWGSGHLLQGTLFTVLVTDDGRVAVGAVSPQALYDALAAP